MSLKKRSMIVCGLVVLLSAIVFGAYSVWRMSRDHRPGHTTQVLLQMIAEDVHEFRRVCGAFPKESVGISALVSEPCFEVSRRSQRLNFSYGLGVPTYRDEWGRPIEINWGLNKVVLRSNGRDGAEGGSGSDSDLVREIE